MIMITRLCNLDPLLLYIVKLWFTGVYIIFLILLHSSWDLVRTVSRLFERVLIIYEYVFGENKKNITLSHLKIIILSAVKIAVYCIGLLS